MSTNDDSQHSLVTSEPNNDHERTSSISISSAENRNGNVHNTTYNGHTTLKPNYKCDFCGKEFQKRSRLLSHVIVHSDEKDFVCAECGKAFKNKSQLCRHSNTHSIAPNFSCGICGRGFKHNDVAKHMRRFHSGPRKTKRGGVANPNAPVNSPFNSRQNIHPSLQPSQLSVFPQSQEGLFQQTQEALHQQIQQSVIILNQTHQDTILVQPKEERLVHQGKDQIVNKLNLFQEQEITKHHSLDLGVSPIDSLSNSSNDSMQIVQTSTSFMHSCKLCSMTFPTESELASHTVSHRLNHRMRKKQHQCHICHKTFTRASGLSAHMELHTRVERRREPNPDFSCNICGKMFTRPAGLKAHILQHGGVLRFWCEEPGCGKGFVHSYQLLRHKRTHSDILPYSCDVCGKFFRHNDLAKHMRIHTGDKPYVCEHCGKAFISSSSLRPHERMHLSLKDHMCEICNIGFTTSAGLRRHFKTHEEDTDALCSSCGKIFPSKLHHNLHLRESPHCSQQQQQQLQLKTEQQVQVQAEHQLQEVNLQQAQRMQVLPAPVSMIPVEQQVEVQQLSHIPVHGMSMQMEAPNSLSIPEVVSQLNHSGSGTAIAATIPQSAVPGHGQPASVDNLSVLVPFPVSVPITVPFGFSHSADQIHYNHFLSWEQKF
ncbi:hypothetical protein ONE63_001146 [Megalurothrips usitatus]|uniref:C2H2-type domain-containing protein n=1 Tax=Megalurothrips usitatus TaxID=439358 RepID=A0AAV7XF02_9NEOP|nr:hypothetical protein ONE63_001146 [Megalurothrips usitatus]